MPIPTWAFVPKCQSLSFCDWGISRLRLPSQFLIDDGLHRQAFAGQVRVDFVEDALGQLVLFEQTAKFQKCVASGADS